MLSLFPRLTIQLNDRKALQLWPLNAKYFVRLNLCFDLLRSQIGMQRIYSRVWPYSSWSKNTYFLKNTLTSVPWHIYIFYNGYQETLPWIYFAEFCCHVGLILFLLYKWDIFWSLLIRIIILCCITTEVNTNQSTFFVA